MNRIIREILFCTLASTVILPTPMLILAWMTGRTLREVLFRWHDLSGMQGGSSGFHMDDHGVSGASSTAALQPAWAVCQ